MNKPTLLLRWNVTELWLSCKELPSAAPLGTVGTIPITQEQAFRKHYFLLMHTQRLMRTEVTLLNHREPSVLLFARKHFVSSELLLWEKQTIRWVRGGELQLRPKSSSPTLQFSTVLPAQSIRTGASEHSTQRGSREGSTRQDPTSEAREVVGHTFSGPCDPFLPLTSYINFRKWH